jgi:hypothetical protein
LLNEDILEALKDTRKKIADLKSFNVSIILKTIEDYEKAEVDQYFIEQQRLQLQKVYGMIGELESKAVRLLKRLE